MHEIKQTDPDYGLQPQAYVVIAGQRQSVPPLVKCRVGDFLVIMTPEQAAEWREIQSRRGATRG